MSTAIETAKTQQKAAVFPQLKTCDTWLALFVQNQFVPSDAQSCTSLSVTSELQRPVSVSRLMNGISQQCVVECSSSEAWKCRVTDAVERTMISPIGWILENAGKDTVLVHGLRMCRLQAGMSSVQLFFDVGSLLSSRIQNYLN